MKIKERKKWNEKAVMALNVRTIVVVVLAFLLITVAYAALTMPKWTKVDGSGGSGGGTGPIDQNLPNSGSSEATMIYTGDYEDIHGNPATISIVLANGKNVTGHPAYSANGTLLGYFADTNGDGSADMHLIPKDGDAKNTKMSNWDSDQNNNGIPDSKDPAIINTKTELVMHANINLKVIAAKQKSGGGNAGGGGGNSPGTRPVVTTIEDARHGYIANDKGQVQADLLGGSVSLTKEKPSIADYWLSIWKQNTIDTTTEIPLEFHFIVKDSAGHVYYYNTSVWEDIDYYTNNHRSITIDSIPFPIAKNVSYDVMFSAYLGFSDGSVKQTISAIPIGLGGGYFSAHQVLLGTYESDYTYTGGA